MTTIRQIVTDSHREAGIVDAGEDLSAESMTEGIRRLNTLYKSLFGNELGDPLLTVNYGTAGLTNSFAKAEDVSSDVDSLYVPSNYRLVMNIDTDTTLNLNPHPRDGARFGIIDNGGNLSTFNVTLEGNGRQVEAADTLVLAEDSLSREWFYRADTGNWMRVTDLTEFDESPLPGEFDDLLITLLAMRINPRHGAQSSDEMIEVLKRIRRIFRARYRQVTEMDSEIGLYHLPSNRRYWQPTTTRVFNRGA